MEALSASLHGITSCLLRIHHHFMRIARHVSLQAMSNRNTRNITRERTAIREMTVGGEKSRRPGERAGGCCVLGYPSAQLLGVPILHRTLTQDEGAHRTQRPEAPPQKEP